jgi:glycosyltransferase involved in cell wall biosynthesis
LTFRYRRKGFAWRQTFLALGKFHLNRVVTILLNQILFSVLISVPVPYLAAQVVCIVVITFINFIACDHFVHLIKKVSKKPVPLLAGSMLAPLSALPGVSVIVPVKSNERTIRPLVESLLSQDYPGSLEIILVGDRNDQTWVAIGDLITQGKVAIIEITTKSCGRDANRKRNEGLRFANGEVLVLTDSDMVHYPHWISQGINLLKQGWHCLGGPVQGANGGFWETYIDKNQFGTKTPRVSAPYMITAEKFGMPYKPAITANLFVTRSLYRKIGGPDEAFHNCYEDYQWDWEIVQEVPILLDPNLVGVIAIGNNIDLYINGHHSGQYPSIIDITSQQGQIGFDVGNSPNVLTEATFSHLEIWNNYNESVAV